MNYQIYSKNLHILSWLKFQAQTFSWINATAKPELLNTQTSAKNTTPSRASKNRKQEIIIYFLLLTETSQSPTWPRRDFLSGAQGSGTGTGSITTDGSKRKKIMWRRAANCGLCSPTLNGQRVADAAIRRAQIDGVAALQHVIRPPPGSRLNDAVGSDSHRVMPVPLAQSRNCRAALHTMSHGLIWYSIPSLQGANPDLHDLSMSPMPPAFLSCAVVFDPSVPQFLNCVVLVKWSPSIA